MNNDITEINIDKYLLSPKEFALEMPLYLEIERDNPSIDKKIYNLLRFSETIDAYCIWCNRESVFNTVQYYNYEHDSWEWTVKEEEEFLKLVYKCSRDSSHSYFVYFLKNLNSITKIGQYPSVADFQIPQAEKYRKILGEDKYKELTRGIGLAAHGVGIGSFVYLRRIFEQLIENAHTEAIKKRFAEKKYSSARMDEKIKLLEDYLPSFLVENRNLYKILSLGIHELKESDCLKYFDSVRIGIEQILDEQIIQEERKNKAEEAKKAVSSVSQEVNQKPKVFSQSFKINKSTYGITENSIEITKQLIESVTNGKLVITASNLLVPSDPAPGTPKLLTIEYEYNGEFQKKEFKEGESVSLP